MWSLATGAVKAMHAKEVDTSTRPIVVFAGFVELELKLEQAKKAHEISGDLGNND